MLQACGTESEECFDVEISVIPRYKTHPPKNRGWGTLRVCGRRARTEFFDVHEFIGKKLSAEIRAKIEAGTERWGLIAGNGRFPFLILEGARSQGLDMAVIALKEEAFSGAGEICFSDSLGEPGGIEQGDRVDAARGRDARGDGGTGKTQQDFQLDTAGLEAGKTFGFLAAKKYGCFDWCGGASAGR